METTRSAVPESKIYEPKGGGETGSGYRALNALKPGMRFKLIALVVSVSLVSVLVSAFLLFSFQRQQLINNAQSATTAVSNTIVANLRHAMLTDDRDMVDAVLRAVVTERTVNTVRILNAQGVVGFSSLPEEVGRSFDRQEDTCQFCHAGNTPPSNQTTVFTPQSGRQILLNINLIENQPECHTCHSSNQRVLGLLMIEAPVTSLHDQLTTGFWRTALLALATFGLLTGLLVPALKRYVIQPVDELAKGVAEISSGNLDHPVQVDQRDELGTLAESFNFMRQQIKASQAERAQREQEAMTLYELGTKISASLTLSEVLNAVAEAARYLLAADIGLVGLLDDELQEIVVKAVAGEEVQKLKGMRLPVKDQEMGIALCEGQPVLVEVYDPQQPVLHTEEQLSAEQVVSFLAVPLMRGERCLGLIEVMMQKRRYFLPHEAQLLMRLAHHVVVSIENAQLYRQLRHLAALEERDRLAREMHDHLAQGLGYLNVKASITDDLLSGGHIDQAHESLSELKKVAKIVYTDVRESIFNLRTAVSPRIGLLTTLQDYLVDYRTHYGLDVHLITENEDLVEFLPEVANQLLRIIQEALTNVRKHAGASRVWIRCNQDGDQICISIEDDGQGFYPDQVAENGRQSFGMQIMRERAESVGGSLEVDSQPGHGTRVVVWIPLAIQE